MVYISNSNVLQGRSWLSVEGIIDLFWAVINFIVLFLKTLVSPGYSSNPSTHSTDYRRSGKTDRGRRIGRVGGGGGGSGSGPSPPPMGGG